MTPTPWAAPGLQLYVHIPADDLAVADLAAVEGLGSVTVARIEDWLARHTAAGSTLALAER